MPRIYYQEEDFVSNLNKTEEMSVELLAIRRDIHDTLERNMYSKNIPLATFYDNQRLETIDAVLKVMTKIDARLKTLENVVQPGCSCNFNCRK